jgi:hypothetical protein
MPTTSTATAHANDRCWAGERIGERAVNDGYVENNDTFVQLGGAKQLLAPSRESRFKEICRPVLVALAFAIGAIGNAFAATEGESVVVLELAVDQYNAPAMTELAAKYEHAEGVPKDLQKANALYCNAAKQGYAEAQFKLGWVYANGRGVQRDDAVAAALFAMAAEQGHEHATKLLRYIPKRSDARLPPCLLPDPIVAASAPDIDVAPISISEDTVKDRSDVEQLVRQLASQYAVDPKLALAVVSVESAFNPMAVSPKNAAGLMQLIPKTAERFGVKRVLNPRENIKGGLAYLRWLLAFFQGNVPLVAAAYNAGERAVEKYRGIPPYPETQDYVRKITNLYKKAKHPYQSEVVAPSSMMARIAK